MTVDPRQRGSWVADPVALNRDAVVVDDRVETTVDLHGHRAASDLHELTLGDEPEADAA
jgi:hypothetical protein